MASTASAQTDLLLSGFGTGFTYARSIAAAQNGDILVGKGNTLVRLNSAGSMVWAFTCSGVDEVGDVLELPGGDLIVAGSFDDGVATTIGVMRTDANGTPVWAKAITSDTVPASGHYVHLARSLGSDFVLYDSYGSERRLSRFTGAGAVVWTREYSGGNSLKRITADASGTKLFATDGSDVYRLSMTDGSQVWHHGTGIFGTAVTIACKGDRLGLGFTPYPGVDAGIAVLDTAGALLGAVQWSDTLSTQGNASITTTADGFALVVSAYTPSGNTWGVFSVDSQLGSPQALYPGAVNAINYDAATTANGEVLIAAGTMIARVDPGLPGACHSYAPWPSFDPLLSGAITSQMFHDPSTLLAATRTITMVPTTIPIADFCFSMAVAEVEEAPAFVATCVPGTDQVCITAPEGALRSVRIMDTEGRILYSTPPVGTPMRIDVGQVAAGLYVATGFDARGGVLGSARFMVIR